MIIELIIRNKVNLFLESTEFPVDKLPTWSVVQLNFQLLRSINNSKFKLKWNARSESNFSSQNFILEATESRWLTRLSWLFPVSSANCTENYIVSPLLAHVWENLGPERACPRRPDRYDFTLTFARRTPLRGAPYLHERVRANETCARRTNGGRRATPPRADPVKLRRQITRAVTWPLSGQWNTLSNRLVENHAKHSLRFDYNFFFLSLVAWFQPIPFFSVMRDFYDSLVSDSAYSSAGVFSFK